MSSHKVDNINKEHQAYQYLSQYILSTGGILLGKYPFQLILNSRAAHTTFTLKRPEATLIIPFFLLILLIGAATYTL